MMHCLLHNKHIVYYMINTINNVDASINKINKCDTGKKTDQQVMSFAIKKNLCVLC